MRRDPAPETPLRMLVCIPVQGPIAGDPGVSQCDGCASPVALSERRAALRTDETLVACTDCYRGFLDAP